MNRAALFKSRLFMRPLVVLVLILGFNCLHAQENDTRAMCLQTLHQAKDSIDKLIRTDPFFQEKLQAGIINPDSLSLSFPYIPPLQQAEKEGSASQKMMGIQKPVFQGIKIRFKYPLDRPLRQTSCCFEWQFLNVQLVWHWSWPNVRFDPEQQKKVMDHLQQAVLPMAKHEQELIRAYLGKQDAASAILEGEAGLRLRLQGFPDSKSERLSLWAYTIQKETMALSTEFLYTLIINDSIYNCPVTWRFYRVCQSFDANPFYRNRRAWSRISRFYSIATLGSRLAYDSNFSGL